MQNIFIIKLKCDIHILYKIDLFENVGGRSLQRAEGLGLHRKILLAVVRAAWIFRVKYYVLLVERHEKFRFITDVFD